MEETVRELTVYCEAIKLKCIANVFQKRYAEVGWNKLVFCRELSIRDREWVIRILEEENTMEEDLEVLDIEGLSHWLTFMRLDGGLSFDRNQRA